MNKMMKKKLNNFARIAIGLSVVASCSGLILKESAPKHSMQKRYELNPPFNAHLSVYRARTELEIVYDGYRAPRIFAKDYDNNGYFDELEMRISHLSQAKADYYKDFCWYFVRSVYDNLLLGTPVKQSENLQYAGERIPKMKAVTKPGFVFSGVSSEKNITFTLPGYDLYNKTHPRLSVMDTNQDGLLDKMILPNLEYVANREESYAAMRKLACSPSLERDYFKD
jgi:hypothetical protein